MDVLDRRCSNAARSSSPRTSSTRTSSPATSPDETKNAQISPTSTTSSMLTTQLSISLSYHCISRELLQCIRTNVSQTLTPSRLRRAVCFQNGLVPGLSGLSTVDTTSLTDAFRTRSLDPSAEPDDLLKHDVSEGKGDAPRPSR